MYSCLPNTPKQMISKIIRTHKKSLELRRLDDLKYIEKLAREDHNMVGKNEVPLFIVDEQEKQQKQETEAEEKKK